MRKNLIGTHIKKHGPTVDGVIDIDMKFRPATDIELKGVGDNIPDGYIAGWASTKDLDSYSHVVATGAFTESINKRGLRGGKGIKLLTGHNWNQVAGVIHKLEYRGDDLWIEAQLELELSYAKDAYIQSKLMGGLNFSVGFQLEEYSWDQTKDKKEFLHIKRGDLLEVSVVAFPGNEEAVMTYVKDMESAPKTIAGFEKDLVRQGLAKSRDDAHKIVLAMKKSLHLFQTSEPPVGDEDTPPAPVLAKEKLDKLTELMASIKATLSA